MKASIIFGKCVNMIALSGYLLNIISLLDSTTLPLEKVNGVFHMLFLVFLLTLEIQEPTPNVQYMQLFLYSFGRGLFYIWISMILLRGTILSVVGSSITGSIGVLYIIFGSCQSCCSRSRNIVVDFDEPSSSTYVFHSPATHPPQLPQLPQLPQYTAKDPIGR